MTQLSEQQKNFIRQMLRTQRIKLIDDIHCELNRSEQTNLIEMVQAVHDRGDESVADLLIDIDLALISTQTEQLKQIEDALKRLDGNSYGKCSECGCEIPYERLKATPTTLRCITCQQKFENNQYSTHPSM